MAESYKVVAKVVSQEGCCDMGHKVGDEWVIGYKTPKDICIAAFNALYLDARVLIFGGTFPWGNDPDVSVIACPDAKNPVVFELRRLRE